jgi:hypothetical protein
MSQGTRGGWARKVIVGLGATMCLTLIGCTEIDKPRFGKSTKQPGPGLPGTPTLQPGTGNVRSGQPTVGAQPMGATGTPAGRNPAGAYPTGGNSGFGTGGSGNSYVPNVGPSNNDYTPISNSNTPLSPAAGMGAGAPSGSFGGAAVPSLDAPELTPPAAPGAAAGVVTPPGNAPIAPTYPR